MADDPSLLTSFVCRKLHNKFGILFEYLEFGTNLNVEIIRKPHDDIKMTEQTGEASGEFIMIHYSAT